MEPRRDQPRNIPRKIPRIRNRADICTNEKRKKGKSDIPNTPRPRTFHSIKTWQKTPVIAHTCMSIQYVHMSIQYVHQTQALVRPPRNAHTAMRTRHHAMRTRHALSAHRVLSPYIHLKQTQTLSPSFQSTRSKRPPRTDLTPTHTHTLSLSLTHTHTQRYKDQK